MLLVDPTSSMIIASNQTARRFYGYTTAQLSTMNINALLPPEIVPRGEATILGEHRPIITPHQLASGEIRTVEVQISPVMWENDPILFSVIHDITEQKRAEQSLQVSEQKSRIIIDSMSEAIIIIDVAGYITLANTQATQLFAYSTEEMVGQTLEFLLPERYRHGHLQHRADYFAAPQIRAMGQGQDLMGRRKDGREFPLEIGLSYAQFDTGMIAIAFITDITERKRVEEVLRLHHERWQFALEGSGDGIWDWNIETQQFFSSWWGEKILRYAKCETSSDLSKWEEGIHSEDRFPMYEQLTAHFQGDTPYYQSEYRMLHQDGSYRWILDRGKVMSRAADGQPLRMVGTHTDITKRKGLEEELHLAHLKMEQLAIHDSLTGVYNRVLLGEKLTQAITERDNSLVAVMIMDMDKFKCINDNYGHHEGDRLLIEVAARMKKLLRQADTLVRLGGDEFLLIVPQIESLTQVEFLVARLLDAARQPFQLADVTVSPSFSVGIALCPKDGVTPQALMVSSDRALYLAKERGRNCYVFA